MISTYFINSAHFLHHFLALVMLFYLDLAEEFRSFMALCRFVILLMIEAFRVLPSLPSGSRRAPFLIELCRRCSTMLSWNFTVIFLSKRFKWSRVLAFLRRPLPLSEADPCEAENEYGPAYPLLLLERPALPSGSCSSSSS